jgi:hypothetical protein
MMSSKDLEGSGHCLIEVIISDFAWRDWGKLQKISVGIAGLQAKI